MTTGQQKRLSLASKNRGGSYCLVTFTFGHSSNAVGSARQRSGIVTSFKDAHAQKAPQPILVQLGGIVTVVNDVHLEKELFPMLAHFGGIVSAARDVHWWNA